MSAPNARAHPIAYSLNVIPSAIGDVYAVGIFLVYLLLISLFDLPSSKADIPLAVVFASSDVEINVDHIA